MRKNKELSKDLKSKILVRYEITGLNHGRIFSAAKKAQINIYDFKSIDAKRIRLSVKLSDSEKFFAITEELCYNVKKVKEHGGFYPFLFFWRNAGLLIGLIIFFAAAYFSNDYIFDISFSGNGTMLKNEVCSYLNSVGVTKFSRFSDVDLSYLGKMIVKSNSRLSFASCEKEGNRLNVELILSDEVPKIADGAVTCLVSDKDGVIESVKVYRGTALVAPGDTVKAGDVLVDGVMTVKENTVLVNVIATVTVISENVFSYVFDQDGKEDIAFLLAREEFSDHEIKDYKVGKTFDGEKYIYSVTLSVRYLFFAG